MTVLNVSLSRTRSRWILLGSARLGRRACQPEIGSVLIQSRRKVLCFPESCLGSNNKKEGCLWLGVSHSNNWHCLFLTPTAVLMLTLCHYYLHPIPETRGKMGMGFAWDHTVVDDVLRNCLVSLGTTPCTSFTIPSVPRHPGKFITGWLAGGMLASCWRQRSGVRAA